MRAGRGVNELGSHPDLAAAMLRAAFEYIAHAEVLADLLHFYRLALVGEGCATRDYKRAFDARQTGGELLCNDIGQIVLPRISAQIGKRQHHNRQPR